jgi:lipopolysaccharide transport system permease protein
MGSLSTDSAAAALESTTRTAKSFQPADPPASPEDLPAEPLTVIEPSRSFGAVGLRELWRHRELLYFLVWRDIKVRYKQTLFGVAWVVLQPLLMTGIFAAVLGSLLRVPSHNVPYPLFAYSGLMLWIFFSGAVSLTGNSLVGNAHLITKVYFPRLIIPLATILARLVDLGVAFVILIGLMLYYRVAPSAHLLMAPFFILLVVLLALGFGLWTSAVNVKYRDVGLALPVLIQLWMFISPVVYELDLVPPRWQLAYSLNPLVGILVGFRASLFGSDFNWQAIAISSGITLALLAYGTYTFRSREKIFADLV